MSTDGGCNSSEASCMEFGNAFDETDFGNLASIEYFSLHNENGLNAFCDCPFLFYKVVTNSWHS